MNRPIKFRAWDGKKMHEQGALVFCTSVDGLLATAGGKVLMQFTGLLDKSGKEIYEGDIILFGDNPIHAGTHGKVIWSERWTQFLYEFIDGQHKGKCTDMYDDWRTYEIIGDIYSNPELLQS